MGGDGGTKAVQRNFLRGAGSASTTGDVARKQSAAEAKAVANEEAERSMTHCAITDEPLDFKNPIVACPYGLLYQKEAAIESLLRRKEEGAERVLGEHIRGLKDLVDVRFQIKENKAVCPITGRVLNGRVAAYVMIQGSSDPRTETNVISEYAIAQLGEDEIAKEYGRKGKLRLVPTSSELTEIKKERESKKKRKRNQRKEVDASSKRGSTSHQPGL